MHEIFATSGCTLGMGNPSLPTGPSDVGSGDMFVGQPINKPVKRKRKMKSLAQFLKEIEDRLKGEQK